MFSNPDLGYLGISMAVAVLLATLLFKLSKSRTPGGMVKHKPSWGFFGALIGFFATYLILCSMSMGFGDPTKPETCGPLDFACGIDNLITALFWSAVVGVLVFFITLSYLNKLNRGGAVGIVTANMKVATIVAILGVVVAMIIGPVIMIIMLIMLGLAAWIAPKKLEERVSPERRVQIGEQRIKEIQQRQKLEELRRQERESFREGV
jgi:hypothetical protein